MTSNTEIMYDFVNGTYDEDFSDEISLSGSVDFEPFVSYDEDIDNFLSKENDWMAEEGEGEYISWSSYVRTQTNLMDVGELPDIACDNE
jgi:hypothetical protein